MTNSQLFIDIRSIQPDISSPSSEDCFDGRLQFGVNVNASLFMRCLECFLPRLKNTSTDKIKRKCFSVNSSVRVEEDGADRSSEISLNLLFIFNNRLREVCPLIGSYTAMTFVLVNDEDWP